VKPREPGPEKWIRHVQGLRLANEGLRDEVSKAAVQMRKSEAAHARELEKVQLAWRVEREDRELAMGDLAQEVAGLRSRLAKSNEGGRQAKTAPSRAVVFHRSEQTQPRPPVATDNGAIEELRVEVGIVSGQFGRCKGGCHGLQRRLAEVERERDDSLRTSGKVSSRCSALEATARARARELEDLRVESQANGQRIERLTAARRGHRALRCQSDAAEGRVLAQEKQIKELLAEKVEAVRESAELRVRALRLEREVAAQADAEGARVSLCIPQPSEPPAGKCEPVMPSACFRCRCLDATHDSRIDVIASAEFLEPHTKIQKIFQTIAAYHSDTFAHIGDARRQLGRTRKVAHKTMGAFLSNVCEILSVPSIPVRQFLYQDESRVVTSAISDLKDAHDALQRAHGPLTGFLTKFQCVFGLEAATAAEAMVQLESVNAQFESQSRVIVKRAKKLHELTKAAGPMRVALDSGSAAFSAEREQLQSDAARLNATIDSLEDAVSKQKREIHTLRIEASEGQRACDETDAALKAQRERAVLKISARESELHAEAESLSQRNSQIEARLDACEAGLAGARRKLRAASEGLAVKEWQIQAAETRRRQLKEDMRADWAVQRGALAGDCEKTIAGLQRQVDSGACGLQGVAGEFRAAKERLDRAEASLAKRTRLSNAGWRAFPVAQTAKRGSSKRPRGRSWPRPNRDATSGSATSRRTSKTRNDDCSYSRRTSSGSSSASESPRTRRCSGRSSDRRRTRCRGCRRWPGRPRDVISSRTVAFGQIVAAAVPGIVAVRTVFDARSGARTSWIRNETLARRILASHGLLSRLAPCQASCALG